MTRLDPRDLELLAERMAEIRLHPDDVELVAERVLEALSPPRPGRLMDTAEVADLLAVDAEFVRDHADELGVIRLGKGKRPRLRFRYESIERFIAQAGEPKPTPAPRRRRRRTKADDNVLLLPVRGQAP